MKGGSLPLVINSPVISPSKNPIKIPTTIAMTYAGAPVIPIFKRMPFGPMSIIIITIAPIATNVDPTERSIPPEMITRVIPRAIMPTPELFRKILIQFCNHVPNQAPILSKLKPRAMVCKITMTMRATPVLNNGRVCQFVLKSVRALLVFSVSRVFIIYLPV